MNRIRTTAHHNRLQAASAAALVAMMALAGASWMTLTVPAEPAAAVVRLERVVITGVRTPDPVVAQLPRVVIEGKRQALADGAQVASACTAPAVC